MPRSLPLVDTEKSITTMMLSQWRCDDPCDDETTTILKNMMKISLS